MKHVVIDKFALLTMTYTREGYEELKEDIRMNGQLVPIIVRKGAILDGRHRSKACSELGIECLFKETGNITDEEALDIVTSNAIQKDTNTDAAKVEAYLICKAKKVKNKEMPTISKRLNKNYVDKIAFIERENPKYLRALLEHKQVRLHNREYDKVENYGTINGIWKTLRSNKQLQDEVVVVEQVVEDVTHFEVDIKSSFNYSSAAESEYWDLYHLGKEEGANFHPSSLLGKKIVELIKTKHFS